MTTINRKLLESKAFASALKVDIQSLAGNGQFFTAEFIKANGEPRKMNCRLAVKKYLRGGSNPVADHLNRLVVYDLGAKGYRTIPLERLTALRIAGKRIDFN